MKFLVATDGTHEAAQAADFGACLAKQSGSELHVCFVVSYAAGPAFLTVPRTLERPPDILRDEGIAALDDAFRLAAAHGLAPETRLLDGDAASEILRYAHAISADFIVTGSAAVALARRSALPIIAIPAHAGAPGTIRRIGVAFDGSAPSHQALASATLLARGCGAALDLAHVVDLDRVTGSDVADETNRGTQLLSAAAFEACESGVPVHQELLEGQRTEALLQWTQRRGDSLLALGTHRRAGLARLGSLAESVLAEAPLPLLLHS